MSCTHAARGLKVNALEAPTWHHLKLNDAHIDFPSTLRCSSKSSVSFEGDCLIEDSLLFDEELELLEASLKERLKKRALYIQEHQGKAVHNEDPSNLELPALSAYQKAQFANEMSTSLKERYASGMGPWADAFFAHHALNKHTILVPEGTSANCALEQRLESGTLNLACLDIIVKEGAQLTLDLRLFSESLCSCGSEKHADISDETQGVLGISLRIILHDSATLTLKSLQTNDTDHIVLENCSLLMANNAHFSWNQHEIGSCALYSGFKADLLGKQASIELKLSHLCALDTLKDFNYKFDHHGEETTTNFIANGILAGSATKTLRGTIDLICGCKGADASEHETVLITDERSSNRSLPVILCSEDDVSGAHGATIGHINEEQLFYLQSRGISAENAESLFIRAKIEEASLATTSPLQQEALERLATKLLTAH